MALSEAEQNDKNYPEKTIFHKVSLAELMDRVDANFALDAFMDDSELNACDTGHCFEYGKQEKPDV